MLTRISLLLLCASGIVACIATTQDVVNTIGPRYVGRNVDEMVLAWGSPARITPLNGGGKAYEFHVGSMTQLHTYRGGGRAVDLRCVIQAIVAPGGEVVKIGVLDDATNAFGHSFCAERLGIKAPAKS